MFKLFRKQEMLNVKVKKLHQGAVVPSYAKEGDAGLDLTAISRTVDEYGNVVYGTGLAFEIPEGYVGLIFPRSSTSKKNIILTNCVGVIDSSYRGEVMLKYKPLACEFDEYAAKNGLAKYSEHTSIFSIGERVGQLVIMPYPKVKLVESDKLSETERGEGGFGSTGK